MQVGTLNYAVDYTATSGKSAGWNSLTDDYMSGPTNYPYRERKMRNYYALLQMHSPNQT